LVERVFQRAFGLLAVTAQRRHLGGVAGLAGLAQQVEVLAVCGLGFRQCLDGGLVAVDGGLGAKHHAPPRIRVRASITAPVSAAAFIWVPSNALVPRHASMRTGLVLPFRRSTPTVGAA